jgi:sugar lactone lactonase YvrE
LYFTDIEGNKIYKVDPASHVSVWRENTNRTNGLYLLPDGRLLCAEGNGPAPRPAPDVAPKEPGNVHYIRPGGRVLLIDDQIARPNGITLSLDGKTLYVDDTEGEYIWAFSVRSDGSATDKRRFVKLSELQTGGPGTAQRRGRYGDRFGEPVLCGDQRGSSDHWCSRGSSGYHPPAEDSDKCSVRGG